MFCDLVGSTALVGAPRSGGAARGGAGVPAACAQVIAKFDGHIAQYLGDGLLVYFGYPQAHEDDAQRAVRTGLGIVEAIRDLNASAARTHATCGLPCAWAFIPAWWWSARVGDGARHEQLALGETPNLAARLQALAEPDAVVISGATQRLVHGLFHVRDLGARALKGVPAPMPVFQVLGESAAQSRLDVAMTAGFTRLIGREQEVGLLLDRWEQVVEGHGQAVLLSGEAGIGKSRLVQVVKERIAGTPHTLLECRCSPYYQHTPLYPVIELLPRIFGWAAGRRARRQAPQARIAPGAATRCRSAEVVPLFASLLSLPAPERYPSTGHEPRAAKEEDAGGPHRHASWRWPPSAPFCSSSRICTGSIRPPWSC